MRGHNPQPARPPTSRYRGRGRGRPGPPLPLAMGVVGLSLAMSGFCAIISELSLFNLAEALLGGTNVNLTYTMGLMMFSMGVGSAFTAHRLFRRVSVELFIGVECALSVLTMTSVAAIYLASGWLPGSAAALIWTFSVLIGLLVGVEIPIVLRINEALGLQLRLSAPLVMAPDYLGSLVAFAAFSFWLLPALGLGRVAWLGGLLNLGVALLVALLFLPYLRRPLTVLLGVILLIPLSIWLGLGLPALMSTAEQLHYRDGIVSAKETPYQRIVVTDRAGPGNASYRPAGPPLTVTAREGPYELRENPGTGPGLCSGDIRLFINGGLQFSTCDEYRYHEMLVHPALSLVAGAGRVLVLGGGDGLAVRELLKYPGLRIKLVELDGAMMELFRDDPRFARLNGGSLRDPRVEIVTGDAFRFLRESPERFDLILMDFPDPHHTATARLYSTQFFRFARRALAPGGILATQSMSPLYQPLPFLTVKKTMEAAGFNVVPLQVPMLTFEHWGFQLGSAERPAAQLRAALEEFQSEAPTRYLNREAVQAALRWDKDTLLNRGPIPVNDQFTLPILELYRQSLRRP